MLREFVKSLDWRKDRDYLDILEQLEHERMTVNLLEDTIRLYLGNAHELFDVFVLQNRRLTYSLEHGWYTLLSEERFFIDKILLEEDGEIEVGMFEFAPFGIDDCFVKRSSIKGLKELGVSEADVNEFYDKYAKKMKIAQRMENMQKWLDTIDSKRKKLEEKSFIDEL